MKIGIGISTYIKYDFRRNYLFQSLETLFKSTEKSNYNIIYYLVDDASPIKIETEVKNNFPLINYFLKENNEGISRSKNDQIKYFIDNNVDIIILADDDNMYTEGFLEECINGLKKTDFIVCSGIEFGYFLCFNKIVVDRIGYFVKCPYVYGGEHYEYVNRYYKVTEKKIDCRNYNLENFVRNIFGTSSIEVDRELEERNKNYLNSENRRYVEF